MYIKTKLILSLINLFEPVGEMLVLIAHAQRPPLNIQWARVQHRVGGKLITNYVSERKNTLFDDK